MKAQTMRRLRQWHLYLGLFFAPALLLFSVSGALQIFRLNEERGYGGPPPTWMVWLGSIHKNQAAPREKKPEPVAKAKSAGEKPREGAPKGNKLPLQIFALLMAVSLALSTLLGIAIALGNRATRWSAVLLLVVGTVVPIVLMKL